MEPRELLERIGDHLHVRRAFGEPYERDGMLVVPVAMVAGGGGGGDDGKSPSAQGAGMGGVVHPLGVYVLRDGEVRFVPALDVTMLAGCVLVVALGAIGVLRRLVG